MSLPRKLALAGVAALAMVAAASAPAVAAEPEGTIRSAGGATAVADSYIVVFKDSVVGASAVDASASSLVKRHGGEVARTWTAALRGFEIKVGAKAAARIAAHPSVAWVEQNHTVSIDATQSPTPSWGLDRSDQRNLPLDNSYTYPNTAGNVHSYIIDTGIRTTHSDFGGRAVWGTNTVDSNNTDCNGHGTHVAGTTGGTAYGMAKTTRLVAVKVLNCQGSGTYAGVISGVNWVTQNAVKPAVANMSLGGPADSSVDTAVANSIASGVTYAIAAGNSNANACNYSPARTASAITVGATQSNDARASYSNFGTCVDIFAPGTSITAPWITNDTSTNTISGTSMASPHVAGAAALVLSANPSYTPQQVRDYLVNNATNGVVTSPGTGSPNKLLYVVNTGTPPVNDFSIAVSPTSGTVTAGGSLTATVSTATTNGSAQTVSLSASGLPGGATASFNPSSVTSGNSSTMTINTTASTPAGTYTVTITGTAASGTKTTTYRLTVNGTGGGCTGAGQKLANPGFESGATSWSATAGVIGQWSAYGNPPRSGSWNAWLNGYGRTTTNTLQQSVTVPSGCTNYTLSFWMHIKTAETTTSVAYDTLRVQVLNSSGTVLATLGTYSNLNKSTGYVQRSFNLSAYAGQTIQVRFLGQEDVTLQTSFIIDDTALNVS